MPKWATKEITALNINALYSSCLYCFCTSCSFFNKIQFISRFLWGICLIDSKCCLASLKRSSGALCAIRNGLNQGGEVPTPKDAEKSVYFDKALLTCLIFLCKTVANFLSSSCISVLHVNYKCVALALV